MDSLVQWSAEKKELQARILSTENFKMPKNPFQHFFKIQMKIFRQLFVNFFFSFLLFVMYGLFGLFYDKGPKKWKNSNFA
jgi:hypothetical protein